MMRRRLFYNCDIYSLAEEGKAHAAMLVGGDGRIERLYERGESLPSGIARLDMGGKTLVPAFIDAHAHFMAKAALSATALNLAALIDGRIQPDSFDGLKRTLIGRAAAAGGPVLGYGLCIAALAEGRLPRASELDSWLPGRRIILLSMDGHSSSYSSAALAALGIGDLAVDGILFGEAHEFNMGKISALILKELSPARLARGLADTLDEAIGHGIAAIHCLEGTEDAEPDFSLTLFKLLAPRLGLRLKLWMQYTGLGKAARHAGKLSNKRVGGCLAWEMDGSVSSRTAALDEDYLDGTGKGSLYRSPQDAYELIAPFYRDGWQTSAHAIGPRGIESALSAYERLMDEKGDARNELRLRIDHFEFPRPDQIARAGARNLVLTVQPGFAWADERYIHSYERALSEGMRAAQCPLRSLLDAGCVICLSTDAPVQPFSPFMQIAGALNHPVPSQRISLHEALRAYSWAGAYACFEEQDRGSLEPGKYADFALLDSDPFYAKPDELQDIRILGTWQEGRRLTPPPRRLLAFMARLLTAKRRLL
jgi:predicted amidohydrolase YtcJ